VLLVIDQLPEWAFEAKREQLTGGGFSRLLTDGEWRVGRHPSFATATGPGHALLGTGEPPARSGIIANEWWSRDENRMITATLGLDGAPSSRFLRVPGLGDAVAAANSGAKAVGIALKARAARLPLGHRGLAIYYDAKTRTWQTHGAPAPAWFTQYTASNPITLAPWTPADPARLAVLSSGPDAGHGEVGEKGFGPTFPHDPAATQNPGDTLSAMPQGNDVAFDMATAAIAGEGLGTDATPDLLVLSLSAHDYIAHGWGHESWEAWDGEQKLDARLATFLTTLDDKVGRGEWAMLVTSDHGGAPLPERQTPPTGRYTEEQIARAANAAASLVLGQGTWIAAAPWPNIYFTPAALAQDKRELATAYRKIIAALRAFPGLAVVDRSDAYGGNCDARTGDARALCLGIDTERMGEFIYAPAAGWVIEEEDERLATAHGSLHDYDRNVPVILLPFGRASHAPQTTPGAEMSLVEVAPILARWLGVTAPTALPR
jgi:peptidoglycan/xylan/chitin deacetylase (PgdA/CDA1 family)